MSTLTYVGGVKASKFDRILTSGQNTAFSVNFQIWGMSILAVTNYKYTGSRGEELWS